MYISTSSGCFICKMLAKRWRCVTVIILAFIGGLLKFVTLFHESRGPVDGAWLIPPPSPHSDKVPVLIIAYMRSGSSFTGELFNANDDAFYMFEPLYSIIKNPKTITFINGTEVDTPRGLVDDMLPMSIEVLENIFACRLSQLYEQVLTSKFMNEGKKSRQLRMCGGFKTPSCLKKVSQLCEDSQLRVAKTIRLSLANALYLLQTIPSLKIIHLLRDPRGIINSRKKIRPTTMFKGRTLCRQMAVDLATHEFLEKEFPDRILRVLYEDLANDIVATSRTIYKFLHMTWPESAVRDLTSNEKRTRGVRHRTQRDNSSVTSTKWRLQIPFRYVRYMDQHCTAVYKKLGYIPFKTKEELINLSLPRRFRHS